MNGVWNAAAVIPAIDFAGGTVVHMSSGWSALVLCLILGPRLGFGKEKMAPHSLVLCMVGTGMLYVGWYGFNAGSAVASDGIAASAFTTTTLAAAVAGFVWAWSKRSRAGTPRCSASVRASSRVWSSSRPPPASSHHGRGHYWPFRGRRSFPGLHQAQGRIQV